MGDGIDGRGKPCRSTVCIYKGPDARCRDAPMQAQVAVSFFRKVRRDGCAGGCASLLQQRGKSDNRRTGCRRPCANPDGDCCPCDPYTRANGPTANGHSGPGTGSGTSSFSDA